MIAMMLGMTLFFLPVVQEEGKEATKQKTVADRVAELEKKLAELEARYRKAEDRNKQLVQRAEQFRKQREENVQRMTDYWVQYYTSRVTLTPEQKKALRTLWSEWSEKDLVKYPTVPEWGEREKAITKVLTPEQHTILRGKLIEELNSQPATSTRSVFVWVAKMAKLDPTKIESAAEVVIKNLPPSTVTYPPGMHLRQAHPGTQPVIEYQPFFNSQDEAMATFFTEEEIKQFRKAVNQYLDKPVQAKPEDKKE